MTVAVAVTGRRGMLRDLVEHVIESNDARSVASSHDQIQTLTILVDPDRRLPAPGATERYVILRSTLDEAQVLDDLRAGADAVFGPDVAADDLVRAIHEVANGGCFLAPPAVRRVVDALRGGTADLPVTLTPREHDILSCAAQGLSVKQTARQLGIAPKTVENLQGRMFRKLDVRNRAQAVATAHAAGLLSPDTTAEEHP